MMYLDRIKPRLMPSLLVRTLLFSTLLFSTLLLSTVSMAETANYNLIGRAYSLETGELLYREIHKRVTNERHQIVYSEPDGQRFAYKTVDLSQSLIRLSFQQLNERNGEAVSVTQEGSNVLVNYKEDSASKLESERLELKEGMVIDAGFDGFIRQYWSVLASGKTLDVEYLVPSKQTTFSFRFSRAECLQGTQDNAMCFSLSPISWVVKMVVDPIVVAYDSVNKTLLRFTGRANICNTQGKYDAVDIQYRPL